MGSAKGAAKGAAVWAGPMALLWLSVCSFSATTATIHLPPSNIFSDTHTHTGTGTKQTVHNEGESERSTKMDAVLARTFEGSRVDLGDFDAMIAAVHDRAKANKRAAIAALERFDYTIPNTTGSPCCPKPNPAAHAPAASNEWTQIAFQWMAPATGALWGNSNHSAIAIADAVYANVSINFKFNGFSPVADAPCVDRVLYPFCGGYGECFGILTQSCNSTRGNLTACAACVASAPWNQGSHYPSVNPLFPTNATCTQQEVNQFCRSTAPLPRDTSASSCEACVAKLSRAQIQCHILHSPVTVMPILKCYGCVNDVSAFCSGLSKAEITHDYCWTTRSRDASKCSFGLPLEQSHFVRGFSLFDPESPRVKAGTVAGFSNTTAALIRELWWGVAEAQVLKYPRGEYHSNVWAMFGSENIDVSNQASLYLALDALSRIPEYSNRTLPDGRPLLFHLAMWEGFWYQWFKERSTAGLFVELASTGYWSRTWPNMFNLVDLPGSARVKMRAKMFVDIAMVEAEQASIAGLRGGQKSRAKRDDITANMYPSITPVLYGTNMSVRPANNTYIPLLMNSGLPEVSAGDYEMPNVSILIHELGGSPDYGGTFLVRNRIIGQVAKSEVTECDPSRCAGTLRTPPCYCTKGSDNGESGFYVMNNVSNQVHTLWRTPSYLLGGVVFSPNDFFSPNTQQRWVGLIFSNAEHSSFGMRHLTGEKWSLIDPDIGIFHKCASCNYGGDTVVDLFNISGPLHPGCSPAGVKRCQENKCMHCGCSVSGGPCPPQTNTTTWLDDGWTFVEVNDIAGEPAWGAVRAAWGGDVLGSVGPSLELTPNDTWAPVIILTGRALDYGTADNFTAAVVGSGLAVTSSHHPMTTDVSLKWRGNQYVFHAQNRTGQYMLPEINGKPVDVSPPYQYHGPHLQGALGGSVVSTVYPGYVLDYYFEDNADKIVRRQ